MRPYDLRCEDRTTPLAVDEPAPRLSWKPTGEGRDLRQAGYRVRVYADGETLWDTGNVDGEDLTVYYDGPPLRPDRRYEWAVTVAGETATSWFETGLSDVYWQASWIGHDPHTDPMVEPPQDADLDEGSQLPPCPQLRRAFELPDDVQRARVYVTARGLYELRVNGHRVGEDELTPGWTDYHTRIQYHCYDVTALLRSGENVLGAIIADGWWSGFVGFDARKPACHYGNRPALLAQLHVDTPDGRRVIGTDASWRESAGPVRYADLLAGERHDARAELPGWDAPGYDDAGWHPVEVHPVDPAVLEAAVDEPVRVTGELAPVEVRRTGSGAWLVDLGQNMVGRVRLRVRDAHAGDVLRLRHAEVLDSDGPEAGPYLDNLRGASATDYYVAAGRSAEWFRPRFTFHGFRYVEITGYRGELQADDVTGEVLHSDTPWAGEFDCSDPDVRTLFRNITWGPRGNFVSVPTDCPQRDERLGWLADAQVFYPTACYNADLAAFSRKWLRDVRDAQFPDGAFSDVAPRICLHREGAPAWGDGGVLVPWQVYRTYGDRRELSRAFDSMAAWVAHVHRHNPDLVWRNRVGNHYGDWLQIGVRTPREVLATAYFAHSTRVVARAAEVLERPDAAEYHALADRIRDTFVAEFVSEDGRVTGETQTAYLLALAFELLPAGLASVAFGRLCADIEARGHLTTGFIGVALLCPVLTEHGRPDLAYTLLHNDSYPSWQYSVRRGATTIWERWDGWTSEHGFQSAAMNSFNHYALGSVGEWLYRSVAGIGQAPGSAGYAEPVIRPVPGGRLTWARARYDSVRGPIGSAWTVTDGTLRLEVELPPGVLATVHVPSSDPSAVQADGAEVVRTGERELVCRVGSGRYTFSAPFDGREMGNA